MVSEAGASDRFRRRSQRWGVVEVGEAMPPGQLQSASVSCRSALGLGSLALCRDGRLKLSS